MIWAVNTIDLDRAGRVPSTFRPMWLPRRTSHPVATTPGPHRAKDLAYLVELTDTGHHRPITQTTVDWTKGVGQALLRARWRNLALNRVELAIWAYESKRVRQATVRAPASILHDHNDKNS